MLKGPGQHHDRCIALEQRGSRQPTIVLPLRVALERVDAEGRVLQRVRVLVGVRELGQRVEARIGHDHHALLVVVVEAEHLVTQQLELELGDVLVGLEQPECSQRGVVLVALLLRVVLVERGDQLLAGLVAGEQVGRPDVCGGQAADRDHLFLDLGQGGEHLVLARRRCLRGRRATRDRRAGRLDRWRPARVGRRVTSAEVEAEDDDPGQDEYGDDDGGEALGSGHCGAFCHAIARSPANVQVS